MTEKGLLEEFTEKDFEELDITDDFLFYSTLVRDMELCRELLEIILNQKIRKVELVQAQRTIKHSYDGKGFGLMYTLLTISRPYMILKCKLHPIPICPKEVVIIRE